jgi:hypothetical protein
MTSKRAQHPAMTPSPPALRPTRIIGRPLRVKGARVLAAESRRLGDPGSEGGERTAASIAQADPQTARVPKTVNPTKSCRAPAEGGGEREGHDGLARTS